MAVIHWGWFDRQEWDGNPLALEPVERSRPACGVRTNDYPAMRESVADGVTCKRCIAIARAQEAR